MDARIKQLEDDKILPTYREGGVQGVDKITLINVLAKKLKEALKNDQWDVAFSTALSLYSQVNNIYFRILAIEAGIDEKYGYSTNVGRARRGQKGTGTPQESIGDEAA